MQRVASRKLDRTKRARDEEPDTNTNLTRRTEHPESAKISYKHAFPAKTVDSWPFRSHYLLKHYPAYTPKEGGHPKTRSLKSQNHLTYSFLHLTQTTVLPFQVGSILSL